MIRSENISYEDDGLRLEGFAAYPQLEQKCPVVILCHAWRGRDDFICEKAKLIAEWGYVGFALDVYGKGVLGYSKEQNAALKAPFLQNRQLLFHRLMKGVETAFTLPQVDSTRSAAVGFGFGGIGALDLARNNTLLKGAVSVYGHFEPPLYSYQKLIKAKILALHGFNDPIVKHNELLSFEKEMNRTQADWQVHLYGNATHAFANPSANDPSFGTVYNPLSSQRAWKSIQNFLADVFVMPILFPVQDLRSSRLREDI